MLLPIMDLREQRRFERMGREYHVHDQQNRHLLLWLGRTVKAFGAWQLSFPRNKRPAEEAPFVNNAQRNGDIPIDLLSSCFDISSAGNLQISPYL